MYVACSVSYPGDRVTSALLIYIIHTEIIHYYMIEVNAHVLGQVICGTLFVSSQWNIICVKSFVEYHVNANPIVTPSCEGIHEWLEIGPERR